MEELSILPEDRKHTEEHGHTFAKTTTKTQPLQEVQHSVDEFRINEETCEEDRESREVEKHKNNWNERRTEALRKDLAIWLTRYKDIKYQNAEASIQELLTLKEKYNDIRAVWEHEVIYLRVVQKNIIQLANCLNEMASTRKKEQAKERLTQILGPAENIQTSQFPKIRSLMERIGALGAHSRNPMTITNITHLIEILKHDLELMSPEKGDGAVVTLQNRLEATIRAQRSQVKNEGCNKKRYDYLMCVSVLQIFCFSLHNFVFDRYLPLNDFKDMTEMLEEHLKNFHRLQNGKQKQAYILKIALDCTHGRANAVNYAADNFPEPISDEICEALSKSQEAENIDAERLRSALDKLVTDIRFSRDLHRLMLKALVCNIKSQFHFLHQQESTPILPFGVVDSTPDKPVEALLDALQMRKYYPQKLKYEDIVMLTNDKVKKMSTRPPGELVETVSRKPTTLPELPWYFIDNILALDSTTRENCHILSDDSYGFGDDSESEDEENINNAIHPLDLIYTIFLCADDFLRQELAEKMTKCQYAVPFILPPSEQNRDQSKNTVLLWGLNCITHVFYNNRKVVNKTMVDIEAPLVTCISLGDETSWKSRLLNEMLSPQQNTFWHQGLIGGDCKQRISHGMVEVSWYLPGGHEDDKFSYPVTFANVRQSTAHSRGVCNELLSSSTVLCLFVEEINEELDRMLENKENAAKVILVILHRKGEEKRMKEATLNLKSKFNLESHQIICRAADDAYFSSVHRKLKKSIDIFTKVGTKGQSLSAFTMNVKTGNIMEVDDSRCYHGQMAAESILKDIDTINSQKSGSAKSRILPVQFDLDARKKMAKLDKEMCRQEKVTEDSTAQDYAWRIQKQKRILHLKQLRYEISDTFKYFLQCLLTLGPTDKKYFLQWLKLGLNEQSVHLLQPLYDECEKCRIEDESSERDVKLTELDEKLMHGSLGNEHLFREMALMYENVMALKEMTSDISGLEDVFHLL